MWNIMTHTHALNLLNIAKIWGKQLKYSLAFVTMRLHLPHTLDLREMPVFTYKPCLCLQQLYELILVFHSNPNIPKLTSKTILLRTGENEKGNCSSCLYLPISYALYLGYMFLSLHLEVPKLGHTHLKQTKQKNATQPTSQTTNQPNKNHASVFCN